MFGFVLFWIIYAFGFSLIYYFLKFKTLKYGDYIIGTMVLGLTLFGTYILFTAEEDSFYIGTSWFMNWYGIIGSIIMFAIAFWISKKQSLEHIFDIISFLMVCGTGLFCFVRNPLFGTNVYHFNAFFTTIYNVYNGATLGIDTNIMYGTYAYLFGPIYKILGLSLNTYAIITVMMCVIILFCEYYIIRNLLDNPVIRFMALSVCIYVNVFFSVHAHYEQFITQHFPMRIFFPMIMLAFVVSAAKRGTLTYKKKIVLGIIVCYLAFMMNLESAITAALTWASGCFYYEVSIKGNIDKKVNIRQGISIAGQCLGGIALAFSAWVMTIEIISFLRVKHFIDVSKLYATQFIFSKVGFYMLPLPDYIHIYIFIFLVYALFIAIGIQRIFYCETGYDFKNQIAFGLSVAGILMLIYYIGRSHNRSLFTWLGPCIILLAYILENIINRLHNMDSKFMKITFGTSGVIIFLILSVYATSEIYVLKYSEYYRDFVHRQVYNNYDEEINNEIEILKIYSRDDTVNYLGNYAAAISTVAGLKNNFLGEMAFDWLSWDDYDYIKEFLMSCDGYIIIDRVAAEQINKFMAEDFEEIMSDRGYEVIDESSLSKIYGASDRLK